MVGNRLPVRNAFDHSPHPIRSEAGMNSAAAANQRSTRYSHQSESRNGAARSSEDLDSMHRSAPTPQQSQQTTTGIEVLGMHINHAISAIHRLEGLGLQRFNLPFPKIVVLGEQSTGKSSVIEAITGIKTPRATGTCTRCPIFIKLENTALPSPWSANVSLRFGFDHDGKAGRASQQRFPGWSPAKKPETVDFMSTDDPDELEDIISRAQLAIVSPGTHFTEFTKSSALQAREAPQCKFSPNVVCVSISCPGSPALSLYDLPGLIGQSEDAQDIKFVKDLVSEYITDPDALVLVTCSLENDIANSTAGGLARKLKATDRCMGVLTKPDRLLPSSCRDVLHDVFETKRLPFGHGYFVVRNLAQDQIDHLSHNDARIQEREFFEHADPFATTFQKYSSRFGTWNLQAVLSVKLAEQITKNLPIIHDEIETRLGEVQEKLKQYPEPPTLNATRIIFDLVLQFTQQIRGDLEGEFEHDDWRNIWEALQKAFFESLLTLKPTMSTFGRRDNGLYRKSLDTTNVANEVINLESDDEEEVDHGADAEMRDAPNTPTKKRKTEGSPGPSPLKKSRSVDAPDTGINISIGDFSNKRTKFQLDEIEKHLAAKSSVRIPGQLDHRVTNAMMMATLTNWQPPLDSFFDKLGHLIRSHFKKMFDKYFGAWAGTALYKEAWTIVMEMLDVNLTQQRTTMAAESLEDEQNGVYIFHGELYMRDKEAMLEHYRQARLKARFNVYKKEKAAMTGKPITPVDENKLLKDAKVMAVLQKEPYSTALAAAAEVTTYYLMAVRRFHDSICMRIESKFLKQLRTQLRDELENRLGIHDEATGHRKAIELLAEDTQREEYRQALLAQHEALVKGQRILHELQQKRYGDDDLSRASSSETVNHFGQTDSGMPTPLSDEMDEM